MVNNTEKQEFEIKISTENKRATREINRIQLEEHRKAKKEK
jgi:hypothetical protein